MLRTQEKTIEISKTRLKRVLEVFCLTFPFLKPSYFSAFQMYDDIFNALRIGAFSLITAYYFLIRRKLSPIAILILACNVYILVNTFSQNGDIYGCAKDIFPIVGIVLLYDVLINDSIDIFIESQLFCFEIVIYINLFTQILYPNGMIVLKKAFHSGSSNWWFLGYYNTYTYYFIPAVIFALLYAYKTGLHIRTTCLLGAVLISSLLAKSGGNIVAIVLMIVGYFAFSKYSTIFNYFNYWLMQVGFYVLIIVLNAQNTFSWLVNDVLNKGASLRGRLLLWKRTIVLIDHSKWYGYGVREGIERIREVRMGAWARYAHNLILEILYQGGFIYLALLCCVILLAGNKMMKDRNNKAARIISMAFFAWSIQSFVEAYMTPFLFCMFVLAYYYDRFNVVKSERKIRFII